MLALSYDYMPFPIKTEVPLCLWIMYCQSYVLVFNVSTLYHSNLTMKSLQVLTVGGGTLRAFT